MPGILHNIVAVARREYSVRARTRTFAVTTVLLMVVGIGVALAPVVIRFINERSGPATIGIDAGSSKPAVDAVGTLDRVMNATAEGDPSGTTRRAFTVVAVADLAAARVDVAEGRLAAVLLLERDPTGDLAFTLYAKGEAFERTPQLIRSATATLAVQDRLVRAGIGPADQARLFGPSSFAFRPAVDRPAGTGDGSPSTMEDLASSFSIGIVLQLFIFMAIMLYGQWVAMSVAEEKSSRVMELVLSAATPFQLLSGKVLGVGALGLTQYFAVFVPAMLGVVLQDRIAAVVLGGTATSELPAGLTVSLLVAFGIMFVLGFGLYAVLYAGAASLVSRQEDVNMVIGPLTIMSTAGYLVAVYAGTGLIDVGSPLVIVLSYVPFLSPYLMLSRIGLGQASPPEVILAMAILAASLPVALWVAARVYSAGVLLYGQRPGLRVVIRLLRNP